MLLHVFANYIFVQIYWSFPLSLSPDRSSFHPFAQEDDSVSIVVVVGESEFPTNAVYKILLQS